ncbi:MAG: response regulator [Parafilimonas sp.]
MKAKKKILIVDDEKELCLLMKTYLSKKNFEVYDTYSLNEGILQMKLHKPDILFLDNNLTDGMGWLHLNKFYEVNPATHIFLMSGFQPALPKISKKKKYKILVKPISFNDLDNILDLNTGVP